MLMEFMRAIAARDGKALAQLEAHPALARMSVQIGATRQSPHDFYLSQVDRHVYAGDTPLHVAAAAHWHELAARLLAAGADIHARNRRGARPLHYAMDGNPDAADWDPAAQAAVVQCLIDAGAEPDALDKSGVGALHRGVRTRCAAAVKVLLVNGAEVHLKNGNGSTPLHLAVQDTGRSGSGSEAARSQQREIILTLLQHGARSTDEDNAGNSVLQSAKSDWIVDLLVQPGSHPR